MPSSVVVKRAGAHCGADGQREHIPAEADTGTNLPEVVKVIESTSSSTPRQTPEISPENIHQRT